MKVAVVDDQIDIATLISHLLKREGHEVRVYGSAQAALDSLEEFSPAVIICDFNMPQMNGVELFQRARKLWNGVFILLTGDLQTNVVEINTIGINHVLFKPLDLVRIIPLLNELDGGPS